MKGLRGRKNARSGWLATTFALAVALVVGSWMNYRGAVAVSTLNRGHADLLELAIREVVRPGAALDSAALGTFLEAHAGTSLRYVALLSQDGTSQPAGANRQRRRRSRRGIPCRATTAPWSTWVSACARTSAELPSRESPEGNDSTVVRIGGRHHPGRTLPV